MLSVSARQLAAVLGAKVDQLRRFEVDRSPLPKSAQLLADCLHDAANAAMGGDLAKRQELERIGKAIRGLDDLLSGQVDEARLAILAHTRGLAQENRPSGRSGGTPRGTDPDVRESPDYALSDCEEYDRLLGQLLRGGRFLRRNTAELLGSWAPNYGLFSLWGGVAKAEKRSAVYSACTLITASGWGFQARGNSWLESLNPFTGNVGYRELLVRTLGNLGVEPINTESMSLAGLERKVAEAYSAEAIAELKPELVLGAKELASGMTPCAREHAGDWADMPLPEQSPLRLLALIQIADWEARSTESPAPDPNEQKQPKRHNPRQLEEVAKKLMELVEKYPLPTAGIAVAAVAAGIGALHVRQDLQQVAAALTLVHLSELGLLPVEPAENQ